MGAVGYMLKPVKRDDLLNALQTDRDPHRGAVCGMCLIVEDDAVQRDSLIRTAGLSRCGSRCRGHGRGLSGKLKG